MPQKIFPWNNPEGLREASQPNIAFATDTSAASHAVAAAKLTGGFAEVDLAMTGALAAAATATTDTAANIIAAIPRGQRYGGFTYKLRVLNESSGAFAWTIAGGTGVTVTGTATVAQNTWRDFVVTVGSDVASLTLQSVGTGTNS